MKIWSQGSGLGRFSSESIKLFSGNIFVEKPSVDASEWNLHVKVCVCRSSLHSTFYGGVVAVMATQNNVISFTHTHTFVITCHVSLRLANVVTGT
jgi:hypothetical protein